MLRNGGTATRRRHLVCYRLLAVVAALLPVGLAAQSADDVSYSRDGADSCLACHDGPEVLGLFRTPHAVPTDARTPFGHGQLQCEACHGPGGEHAARVRRGEERPPVNRFGNNAATPVSVENDTCTGCHEADMGFGWHTGPHARNDIACADCHRSHTTEDAVLHASTQPTVCFKCHTTTRSETRKAFAHPISEGKMECGGCHSPHGATIDEQLKRQTVNDTCYECHAEKRGPWLWEHAPVAEDCTLCHAPHGSNHAGMLTRRAPLLCQGCHSQRGHPSIAQTPEGLPDGAMPSQFLLATGCLNCHEQVHGSNHPSGSKLMR